MNQELPQGDPMQNSKTIKLFDKVRRGRGLTEKERKEWKKISVGYKKYIKERKDKINPINSKKEKTPKIHKQNFGTENSKNLKPEDYLDDNDNCNRALDEYFLEKEKDSNIDNNDAENLYFNDNLENRKKDVEKINEIITFMAQISAEKEIDEEIKNPTEEEVKDIPVEINEEENQSKDFIEITLPNGTKIKLYGELAEKYIEGMMQKKEEKVKKKISWLKLATVGVVTIIGLGSIFPNFVGTTDTKIEDKDNPVNEQIINQDNNIETSEKVDKNTQKKEFWKRYDDYHREKKVGAEYKKGEGLNEVLSTDRIEGIIGGNFTDSDGIIEKTRIKYNNQWMKIVNGKDDFAISYKINENGDKVLTDIQLNTMDKVNNKRPPKNGDIHEEIQKQVMDELGLKKETQETQEKKKKLL